MSESSEYVSKEESNAVFKRLRTKLDNKVHEIKVMEAGGNANAKAFFRDHGVSDMKVESKYQTRAAQLYKHKLKELTDDSKKKKSAAVYVAEEAPQAAATSAQITSTTPPASTSSTKPPKKQAPKFEWEEEDEEKPEDTINTNYYTTAPSKSAATSKPTATSPDSRPATTTTKTAGRLGAKKVTNNKSLFAEFDLESDEEKEEELPPPPTNKGKVQTDDVSSKFNRLSYYDEPPAKKNSPAPERSPSTSSDRYSSQSGGRNNKPATRERDDGTDYARKNFTAAKSISSDQYFGTDKQDSNQYERESRMAKFQGASAISSAAYFDRDESTTMADMSASDVARKFAYSAKTDLGQISNVVGEGAKKITAIASSLLSDLQDRYS